MQKLAAVIYVKMWCKEVFIVTAKGKALDYKDIGLRIKTLRIKNNIYQTELAKDIGVSQTHMSNIESGRAGITLENLVKMAEVFKCGIDEIIYGLRPQHEDIRTPQYSPCQRLQYHV